MIAVNCPECKSEISLTPNPKIGMQLACYQCNSALEIIWLFPPMLDYCEQTHQVIPGEVVTAKCPKCKAENILGATPSVGSQIACSQCKSELEVIWLFPPMLDTCDHSNGTYPQQQQILDSHQL